MTWNCILEKYPPVETKNLEGEYVLAYHTKHGVGIGWFYKLDEALAEEIEEGTNKKYLVTCDFLMRKKDGNFLPDIQEEIDVMQDGTGVSPLFKNIGTITHWQELPDKP